MNPEDRDFSTYRDTGDSEALARVFDVVAPRLLLLAAHLTMDAADAEDLVQATFLRCMVVADDFDGARPVSPWLAGILRHRALEARRRSAIRQTEPLRAATHATDYLGLDAMDLASENEVFEQVSTAIGALENPYREVLLLRLVHGLEPTEIAHTLGRKPGSVRMQLKRGLEKLQREVPQFSSILGLALSDSARGLPALREAVLVQAKAIQVASTATSALVATTSLSSTLSGLFLMKSLWFAVATCLFGIGLLWFHNADGEPKPDLTLHLGQSAQPQSNRMILALTDAAGPKATPRSLVAGLDPAKEAIGPSASNAQPVPGELTVRVSYLSDGDPAVGIGVYAQATSVGQAAAELRTDAFGRVTFADLSEGPWLVHVDRLQDPILVEDSSVVLDVFIPIGFRLRGSVVDLEGLLVPGAEIFRFSPKHPNVLQAITIADQEGQFEIRDIAVSDQFLARAPRYQPSSLGSMGWSGEPRLTLTLGARGNPLTGFVTGLDGDPVPHARVAIAVDEDARDQAQGSTWAPSKAPASKPLERELLLLRADATGRFKTDEVPAGHAVIFARPPVNASLPNVGTVGVAELWISPSNVAHASVTLEAGAEIVGVARDETGAPMAGLLIQAEWRGTWELGSPQGDLEPEVTGCSAVTLADGSFRLSGLLEGRYGLDISVSGRRLLEEDPFQVERNATHVWNPVLRNSSSLTIRLLAPDQTPLEGFGAAPIQGALYSGLVGGVTNEKGELTIRSLDLNSPIELALFAPFTEGLLSQIPSKILSGIRPSPDVLEVQLAAHEWPLAAVHGMWVDQSGEPVREAGINLRTSDGQWEHETVTDANGEFAFAWLPAGDYDLRTGRSRFPLGIHLDRLTLTPGQILHLDPVGVKGTTRLIVELTNDGKPDEALAWLSVEQRDLATSRLTLPWTQSGSTWTSAPIAPGSYRLFSRGPDCTTEFEDFIVGNESELHFAFEREPGELVSIDIEVGPDAPNPVVLGVQVWDSAGNRLSNSTLFSKFDDNAKRSLNWTDSFRPGSYRIEATNLGSPDSKGSLSFTVQSDGTYSHSPLRISLP